MTQYHLSWSILMSVFTTHFNIGNPEIVTGPRSTEIQVGSPAYFNCSTSLQMEIYWIHYAVGANESALVYGHGKFYPPYDGRFEIKKNETTYNLIIPSAQMDDAGKYECQDQEEGGDKKDAQLTVLGQGPICQSDKKIDKIIGPNSCGIEPDDFVLTCTIQYKSNEVPILEWRNLATNGVISKGITVGNMDDYVTLNLTMKGEPSIDDTSYLCQISISTPTPYSCNIGPVKVIAKSETSCKPCVTAVICAVVFLICLIVTWYLVTHRQTCRRRTNEPRTSDGTPASVSLAEETADRSASS